MMRYSSQSAKLTIERTREQRPSVPKTMAATAYQDQQKLEALQGCSCCSLLLKDIERKHKRCY